MTSNNNSSLLDDLYRDILLDHYRNPRHKGHVAGANHVADGANPLCGDQITVEALVGEDDRVEEIAFTGTGCSISQASSSMMAAWVPGKSTAEALAAVATFAEMMRTGTAPEDMGGDIEALAGVAKFPVRVKCASLAWKTLEQALVRGSMAGAPPVTTDDGKE
jgi:nitrogen fixation NifU-like protein